MSRFLMLTACCLLGCVVAAGCGESTALNSSGKTPVFEPKIVILDNGESSYITVQHVLIAFRGTLPGKPVYRTEEEAESLANEILERAKSGEDFGALVREFTDDQPPGIYQMANSEQPGFKDSPNQDQWVYPRNTMVAAFGDVGFPLEVGEIGMAPYDAVKSPFGWHIIKRLK